MGLPLIPLLIGAVAGAAIDEDEPLRGAAIGGTLGALTGGVGLGGTASSTTATGATGATGVGSTAGGVATAGELGGKLTAAQQAQIASTAQQSLTPQAQAALTGQFGLASPAAGVQTGAGAASSNPFATAFTGTPKSGFDLAKTARGVSMLTGEEEQQPQQAPPPQPLPQSTFTPVTPEEQMARVGGNEPTFVPKGLFEEERTRVASEYIQREEDQLLFRALQSRGLA